MTTALAIVAGAFFVSATIYLGAKRMSQATDRLTASVKAASDSADALIARIATIPAPPVDEAPIIAAADAVDALKSKLDATIPAA
jgi:hypothetical protein